jgi:hypothetical protein
LAAALTGAGFATLTIDLLTEAERVCRGLPFDVKLLADRLAEVTGWLRTARSVVGDRRLVWVNLRCDPAVAGHLDRYRAVNAALAAAAPRYGVELADWDGWAAGAGVPNGRDGVHYGEDAYRLRALFYAAAVG